MINAAQSLFNRLTEIEKIDLRRASDARLEHLAHAYYGNELKMKEVAPEQKLEVMKQTRDLAMDQYRERDKDKAFGKGWTF